MKNIDWYLDPTPSHARFAFETWSEPLRGNVEGRTVSVTILNRCLLLSRPNVPWTLPHPWNTTIGSKK